MASIKNSISLQDRMTPVFRSVIKSMDSTLKVMRQLDRQANNGVQSKAYRAAERDLKRANNELIRMQNNLDMADKQAKNLKTSTQGISFSGAGAGLSAFLTGLSSALYLAKNIGQALSKVMETPDTISAIKYRLDTYDTTGASGSQLMDAAYKAAQASRSDIQSTADLASRILITGATNGSGAEAINIAETLNKASFLGGSSSQESQRALLQLSQGLASGALQGDELRAIREQAPGLTDTLAKGLSKLGEKGLIPDKFINTTMGDLKQLGADGELTAQRIIAAFKEMEDQVDIDFENSPKQFKQAVTGILNVWKRWLGLMGEGDNALAKINQKAWELLEWFESPAGDRFFTGLANGINFVVDGILKLVDWVGGLITSFSELDNSSQILQSGFMALGIVAVGAAAVSAAAWVAANWKILLAVAAVALLIYAFEEMGYTASEIIGAITGGIEFLAFVIYDVVLWVLTILGWIWFAVWNFVVKLILGIIWLGKNILVLVAWILQGIVQGILWLVTTIDLIMNIIFKIFDTVTSAIDGVIKAGILGIWIMIVGLCEAVLGVIWTIAKAIDAVFGSKLADAVGGWMSGLGSTVEDLRKELDPLNEFAEIGDTWTDGSFSNIWDKYAGRGEYDDWNITDKMKDVNDWGLSVEAKLDEIQDDYTFTNEDYENQTRWSADRTLNPMDGWDQGYEFGSDVGAKLEEFTMQMEGLGDTNFDEFKLNGGNLDSVGSIGSDVEISDEDLELLRDVAARDFLLTLQTSTPQVHNTFGDIKETADVGKILETIQDMVDEQLAVSLVVE